MEKPHQIDIFREPQREDDERIVQEAELTAIQEEEAGKEEQSIREAMKEERYCPDKKKSNKGRKEWLALGRKLNGEDNDLFNQ